MNTIQLTNKNVFLGNLILVNAEHPINDQYYSIVHDLMPLNSIDSNISLASQAKQQFENLLKSCNAQNEIVAVSGYRSLYEQISIMNDCLKSEGVVFTNKYVAKPNCSEHQTGLAIDVAKYSENIDYICPNFPYKGVCQHFRTKATNYGFIERYESAKEQITGIAAEPWHFRYVGYPHSAIIKENNLTLEEYHDYIKNYSEHEPYIFEDDVSKIKITYLRLIDRTVFLNVTNKPWQISGNNKDGIVYTQWT